jgi:aspartyl-tRNA(Asn)/glutamyl-tRNA(Gln) amidotransferase subunit C
MTARLDDNAVRHVAHLARLRLSDAEIETFREQLSRVLEYMAQLNELDTTGVPPTAHALAVCNIFRDDVAQVGLDCEAALHNAPARDDSFFQVPKVLDQEAP